MELFTAARLDLLEEKLVEALLKGLQGDALSSLPVVVPSPGFGEWLTGFAARKLGIAAGFDLLTPGAFESRLRQWAGIEERGQLASESLVWALMGIFSDDRFMARLEMGPLNGYLSGGQDGEHRRFQMATQVADLFDQYQVFRPELLTGWETEVQGMEGGGGEHGGDGPSALWQRAIWRELFNRFGERAPHRHRQIESMTRGGIGGAPPMVLAVGLSLLPPRTWGLLHSLSKSCRVMVFLQNPAWHFTQSQVDGSFEDHHLQERRPYLPPPVMPFFRKIGVAGGEFFSQVYKSPGLKQEHKPLPPKGPSPPRLLGRLQTHFDTGEDPCPGLAWDEGDDSLQVYSAHGPRREVEILHDRLLDLFQKNHRAGTPLFPRDILVTATDVETYAPFIEAVFSATGGEDPGETAGARAPFIPWHFIDRGANREGGPIAAFLGLMALKGSPLGLSQVLGVLGLEPIRRRMGFDESQWERLCALLESAGIRWGLDPAHIAEEAGQDLTEVDGRPTWERGLTRLVWGVAMAPRELDRQGNALVGGLLPAEGVEGENLTLLSSFLTGWNLVKTLLLRGSEQAKPPQEWAVWAHGLVDALIFEDEGGREENRLRLIASAFGEGAREAGANLPVPFRVFARYMEEKGAQATGRGKVLDGRLAVASFTALRGVPYRVIAVLGLGDDQFPPQASRLGFDLGRLHPRWGDRDVRAMSRWAFVDTLQNAKENLILSFPGKSERDNKPLLESQVLSDLFGHLKTYGLDVEGKIWVEAPLHPTSALHFDPALPRLHSFHPEYLVGPSLPPKGIMLQKVTAAVKPELLRPTLSDLLAFLSDPMAFTLQRNLGIRLPRERESVGDSEPLEERDTLRDHRLVEGLLTGEVDREGAWQNLDLPHGPAGRRVWGLAQAEAESLGHWLKTQSVGKLEETQAIGEMVFGDVTLTGNLSGVYGDVVLSYSTGAVRAKHRLALWVKALVVASHPTLSKKISALAHGGYDKKKGEVIPVLVSLGALDPGLARKELGRLLRVYRWGLSRLLPFYPDTAWEFRQELWKKTGGSAGSEKKTGALKTPDFENHLDASLEKAQKVWEGGPGYPGERSRQEFLELYDQGFDPFAEDHRGRTFRRLAALVTSAPVAFFGSKGKGGDGPPGMSHAPVAPKAVVRKNPTQVTPPKAPRKAAPGNKGRAPLG